VNETLIYSLLQGIQRENPRIHDLIRELIQTVQEHNNSLFPSDVTIIPPQIDTDPPPALEPPINFRYELIPEGIKFDWDRSNTASVFFEIRKGLTWEDGLRQVVTPTLSAVLRGDAVGVHQYWIKSYDENGLSSTEVGLIVEIPPIGEVALSGYVVDNFILLQWSNPESAFKIDYFIVSKNGAEVGEQQGTFITLFEDTGGTYTYSVRAVDIYGNVSNDATIDLTVSQPADYVLYDVYTDDFLGTKVNVYRDPALPSIYASLNLNETWQQYADNGYASMQDEINDSLPYWLQPTSPGVGSYTRTVDFGITLEAIICNVSWAYHEIVPFTSVRCFMSTSEDGIAFTTPVETKSLFIPIFRFVRVHFDFLALN
jgi:hypothetical protein